MLVRVAQFLHVLARKVPEKRATSELLQLTPARFSGLMWPPGLRRPPRRSRISSRGSSGAVATVRPAELQIESSGAADAVISRAISVIRSHRLKGRRDAEQGQRNQEKYLAESRAQLADADDVQYETGLDPPRVLTKRRGRAPRRWRGHHAEPVEDEGGLLPGALSMSLQSRPPAVAVDRAWRGWDSVIIFATIADQAGPALLRW
jgi:hypothetical protein